MIVMRRRELDRADRVACGERDDGRREQREERRVGAEHEDARRTDQEVADQGPDRGVQAGDRRQPGRLRVPHPDRHEDGGQGEPRREVRLEVGSRVARADARDRREGGEHLGRRSAGGGAIDRRRVSRSLVALTAS